MPERFLSALSPFSPIQKKFGATSAASALRSFFSAAAPICLRNASKLGSLSGSGALIATGWYGFGIICCCCGGAAWRCGGGGGACLCCGGAGCVRGGPPPAGGN